MYNHTDTDRNACAESIKLILSDIDGTILPYGKTTVSQTCRDAFHAALDAGIRVGPASGRAAVLAYPVFDGDTACCRTALATNGMEIYLDGSLIHQACIAREHIVALADAVRDIEGCGLVCFDGAVPLVVEGSIEDLGNSFPAYAPVARYIDDVPHKPIVKVNVFTPADIDATREVLEHLRTRVTALDYSLPHPGFVNMTPRGWNKGEAVTFLCRALGIGLEQVVVFGDANNDIEMLSAVPNSVAVAGATADAKAAARWHIGPVEEDAVPRAIAAIARGEWPFTA